jgi:DNA-binding MarR family transcriptional regulator
MDFRTAAQYASLLSKDYAEDIFRLLVIYQAISASEVATRLNLHIKTAQDFLESLEQLGVLSKEEVLEKKRPYYRYILKQTRLLIDIDLMQVKREPAPNSLTARIRERENAGARFLVARNDDYITSVTIWTGEGRSREERKIKLTTPQGRFLYHLPFPKAEPLTVDVIMQKAGIDASLIPEILDLVQLLEAHRVLETQPEVEDEI